MVAGLSAGASVSVAIATPAPATPLLHVPYPVEKYPSVAASLPGDQMTKQAATNPTRVRLTIASLLRLRGSASAWPAEALADPEARRWLASDEHHLSAGRLIKEVHRRNHVFHLGYEVVFRPLEHVHRHPAGIQMRAAVAQNLEQFVHRRNVQLLHLLLHHGRRQALHSRQAADHGRDVHRGVADRRHMEVIDGLLRDDVEAPEREEERRVDAAHPRGVR